MIRRIIFISDLHLDESQVVINKIFLEFLSNLDTKTQALYILGDLFEVWIGDDNPNLFIHQLTETMRSVTKRGINIYVLHGNRDFLIGQHFLEQTGCELLHEEEKIFVYGTPVLLMHGDTLCTNDKAYLKARKILRHPLIKILFLSLPLKIRRHIAAYSRRKSMSYTKLASQQIMDVVDATVKEKMNIHQVQYLIHGHTHRPGLHTFNDHPNKYNRIVLGAWHDHAEILIWDENNNKKLIKLR